ncbi:hypothetical protein A2Y85_05920 [candidate division WOR-3 bacterium RBG_13_43_14]|uniref:AMP-dependent synthetase/ligase domain-containing protein n=1 Tax=candidate division WOR-3 bacterium RBG_13_43_14 TaxID=1802590 RepID=A0A1F4U975_UNCW3|nr:MAG: hypothetical protein A2Y85_05920 [candidate division WOR-3 bacterium RBG_13_43_14]
MERKINFLGDVFENAVARFPDKLALKKEDVTYTYAQLKNMVEKLKNHLISLGLKKGDRFAVHGENRPEWAVAYLAIVRAGLVCVPLDRLLSEAEILHILRQSEARGVIVSENCIDNIESVKGELKDLEDVILMNKYGELPAKKEVKVSNLNPDDLAVLIFTSGTTGTSKAVMLSHNNILSNLHAVEQVIPVDETDTMVSIIPMHHTFEATAGFLYPLYKGSAIYYPPSLKPNDIIDTFKEANVSCLIAVPLLFEKFLAGLHRKIAGASLTTKVMFRTISGIGAVFKFLRKPLFAKVRKQMGMNNLRLACAGGAALTAKVAQGLELLGLPMIQGYGLTESSPVISVSPLEKPKSASVGTIIPGVEVKIDDPDENGIGEVIVRGPNIMLGYYKNNTATEEVIRNGWLYTGDLGKFDSEGYLYIAGRKKSLIVTQSGKNIYPEELEEKLIKSPWVREILVVPRIDPSTKKELICALVFPDYELLEEDSITKGKTYTEEDVKNIIKDEIRKVNEELPAYKKVIQFEIREEEFPKTTTQKIKRHMFIERAIKV